LTDTPTTSTVADLRDACEVIAAGIEGAGVGVGNPEPEDEESFREVCLAHGVAPLLHSQLRDAEHEDTPRIAWLRNQHEHNTRRVYLLRGELRAILLRFAAQGVEVMPMKGIAVAELLYSDPGARPMNDLDLLVKPNQLEWAGRVLAELGYERVFAGWKHVKFLKSGNRTVADASCEHPDNPRPVEVHPRCVEQIRDFEADLTDTVWTTACEGTVAGEPALTMAPDAQWLYTLAHATHHILLNNFRLIQLVDLRRLLPLVGNAAGALGTLDARATVAPLALLHRYFPDGQTALLLSAAKNRVSKSFGDWAESLDLYNVCFLNPVSWRG